MKMLPITEGEIYVDGVEIQHMNSEQTKEYRKKIQWYSKTHLRRLIRSYER